MPLAPAPARVARLTGEAAALAPGLAPVGAVPDLVVRAVPPHQIVRIGGRDGDAARHVLVVGRRGTEVRPRLAVVGRVAAHVVVGHLRNRSDERRLAGAVIKAPAVRVYHLGLLGRVRVRVIVVERAQVPHGRDRVSAGRTGHGVGAGVLQAAADGVPRDAAIVDVGRSVHAH